MDINSGHVILDSTVVSGEIVIRGVGKLTDNAGPNTNVVIQDYLNPRTIADQTWDEATADHTASGSFGEAISDTDANLLRAIGLMQENYYLDQTVYTTYNGAKLLTSGRLRTYTDAGSVGTSSNVLATYTISASWSNDELSTYQVVKQ
jgi:purine nucleoside phosphorylase